MATLVDDDDDEDDGDGGESIVQHFFSTLCLGVDRMAITLQMMTVVGCIGS